MYVEVKDLNGVLIDTFTTNVVNLNRTAERVKLQYPPEQFHASLVTY